MIASKRAQVLCPRRLVSHETRERAQRTNMPPGDCLGEKYRSAERDNTNGRMCGRVVHGDEGASGVPDERRRRHVQLGETVLESGRVLSGVVSTRGFRRASEPQQVKEHQPVTGRKLIVPAAPVSERSSEAVEKDKRLSVTNDACSKSAIEASNATRRAAVQRIGPRRRKRPQVVDPSALRRHCQPIG